MSDKKEKRISKVREMKNNLILDAALNVFDTYGYHEARLEDIAKEAGFSKASLYNYYKDKETIFYNLALREHDTLIQRMEEDPLFALNRTLSFPENIKNFMTLVFDTFGKHFGFLLQVDEVQFMKAIHGHELTNKCSGDSVATRFMCSVDRVDSIIGEMVKIGREKGEINSPLSDEILIVTISGMIMSVIKHWRKDQKLGDTSQTVENLLEILCNGFRIKQ